MGLGFTFTARDLASGTIGRLKSELSGLGVSGSAATSALSRGMSIAAAGIVPLAAGLGGLAIALGVVEAAASGLHEVAAVGAQFENVQIRMAGTLQALHFVDSFEGGMDRSSELIRRIHADAAALPGEAQDYVNVFTQALPQIAGAMDGNLSDMTAWADRFTAIAVSLGVDSAQAARDLQLMLATGRGRAGANVLTFQRLLPFIQASGEYAHLTAQQFNAMSETERWTVLEGAMAGLNDQLAASSGTWDAVVGATQTMWDNLLRISTAPLFTQMKRQLDRINGLIMNEAGELTAFGQAVADIGMAFADAVGATLEIVTDMIIALANGTTGLLQALARGLRSMPNWVIPAAFATWILVSAVTALAGAGVVLVGVLVMVSPFLLAITKVMLGMAIVLAPLTLAVIAFVATVVGIALAIRNNWGGLGEFWTQTLDRMRLAWTALGEAIERGGFTQATSDALRAEPGIRRFVIGIAMMVFRLRQMWEGFSTGFQMGWERMQPAIMRLGVAIRRLAATFGFLGDDAAKAGGMLPSEEFAEFGARIAENVIGALETIVRWMTWLANTGAETMKNLGAAWEFFGSHFTRLAEDTSALWTELGELLSVMGVLTGATGDTATAGEVLAFVFVGFVSLLAHSIDMIVNLVRAVVWAATAMRQVSNAVGDFFTNLAVRIHLVFMRILDSILNTIDMAIAQVAGLVSQIPAQFRPDGAEELIAAGGNALNRVSERSAEASRRELGGARILNRAGTNEIIEAEAQRRAAGADQNAEKIASIVEAARVRDQTARTAQPPQIIELRVDSETLARVTNDANRVAGAQAFRQVGAGTE